jgi:hypothetical protein
VLIRSTGWFGEKCRSPLIIQISNQLSAPGEPVIAAIQSDLDAHCNADAAPNRHPYNPAL